MEKSPLSQLLDLAGQKEQIEADMRSAVAQARAEGASWQAIANKIGGTKQAAQQKYSGPKAEEKLLLDQVAKHHAEDAPILAAYAAKREAAAAQLTAPAEIDQLPTETTTNLDAVPATHGTKNDKPCTWRPSHILPGKAPMGAQAGTGTGPQFCPNCDCSNHKTTDNAVAEFTSYCEPTQYDPQRIADFMRERNAATLGKK